MSTRTRWPAARRRRRNHPVQLPRDGAPVDGAVASPAATSSSSSPPSRTRRRLRGSPSCGPRPGCRTASSASSTATRRPSTPSSSTPASRGLVRRLDPGRQVHLRDRHRERQARPGARRGQEPRRRAPRRRPRHDRRRARLRRLRLGRAALHGRVGRGHGRRRRRPLIDKVRERIGKLTIGPGTDPSSDMGPLVSERHHEKVAGLVDSGSRKARTGGRRPRPRRRGPRARLLPRPLRLRPRQARHADLRRGDLRPGAGDRALRQLPGGARAGQRQPVRQRRRDLHCDGGAARRSSSRRRRA